MWDDLDELTAALTIDVVIEGGARGADRFGRIWAQRLGLEVLTFNADWDRWGRSAGFRRNEEMLTLGKPDLVIAYVDKPLVESRGTKSMVDLARDAHVLTKVRRG
jgi:hypothetical protein